MTHPIPFVFLQKFDVMTSERTKQLVSDNDNSNIEQYFQLFQIEADIRKTGTKKNSKSQFFILFLAHSRREAHFYSNVKKKNPNALNKLNNVTMISSVLLKNGMKFGARSGCLNRQRKHDNFMRQNVKSNMRIEITIYGMFYKILGKRI